MASAVAGGTGPRRWAALALAVVLLWLWPPLRAQSRGTTAGTRDTAGTQDIAAVCGRPVVAGKILGGSDAPEQRWPWQASLQYRGKHICGAALVDTLWVVSAAHCFQKSHNARDYLVLLGYQKLHEASPFSLKAAVSRLIVHGHFDKGHFMASDVALLQLKRPVRFTPYVLPACLPKPDTVLPMHAYCWVTGWGMLTETDVSAQTLRGTPILSARIGHLFFSQQLQEGQVSLLDRHICTVFFQVPNPSGQKYSINEDVLCAGTMSDDKSICRGDSGGPLSCQLNDTWFLMGLSSWSLPCRRPVSPSVFTRLTHFSSWILEKQRDTPPPPRDKPVSSNGPPSTGAAPGSRVHRTQLLSRALPLLLLLRPLSLLRVP